MGQARKRRAHCAFCGAPAVSVDHLPPRSLFPGDKINLITVPSCEEHNGKRSGLDERFRNYVATHIGDDTPEAQALLAKTARAVSRNKSAQKWRPDLSAFEVEINQIALSQ
jgi:hypothetical protein